MLFSSSSIEDIKVIALLPIAYIIDTFTAFHFSHKFLASLSLNHVTHLDRFVRQRHQSPLLYTAPVALNHDACPHPGIITFLPLDCAHGPVDLSECLCYIWINCGLFARKVIRRFIRSFGFFFCRGQHLLLWLRNCAFETWNSRVSFGGLVRRFAWNGFPQIRGGRWPHHLGL